MSELADQVRALADQQAMMVAELRTLRELLIKRSGDADRYDAGKVRELLESMQGFGRKEFTVAELLDHADLSGSRRLRVAIDNVVGAKDRAIALGLCIRHACGVDHDGLTMVRCGKENGVAIWRVEAIGARGDTGSHSNASR